MTDTEQFIHNLQGQIDQLKTNEDTYRYQLDLLKQSRSRLTDEIDNLSLDYEKKIKQLQLKVKRLTTENQVLLMQNEIYKQEIQNFQSRLMEKERLISMLVTQQNQYMPNLDTSLQSEKIEETQVRQKKSIQSTKNKHVIQDIESQQSKPKAVRFQKKKILTPIERQVVNKQQETIKEDNTHNLDKFQEAKHHFKNETEKKSNQNSQQIQEKKTVRPAPPPPIKKAIDKHPKPPRHNNHRNIPKYQSSYVQQNSESNFFTSQAFLSHQQNNAETQLKQNTQIQFVDDQNNQKVETQNLAQTIPAQSTPIQQDQFKQNQYVQQAHGQQQNDDLLNHFYSQDREQYQEKQQTSAVNFFNNLSQNSHIQNAHAQNDIHVGQDLQQSSIDYHDNSIMSSNANVFAESTELVMPPKKTMPKKKAKRDKIKVADPGLFE